EKNIKISYDTAKKRMQEILPSERKKGALDQSHNLAVFESHALLIHYLIYNTKYRRYLTNPTGKNTKIPEYEDISLTMEAMFDLLLSNPLIELPSEVFVLDVIEDTYHFNFFNAITKFIMRINQYFISVMNMMRDNDYRSISVLFAIDQMMDDVLSKINNWTIHFNELIAVVDVYSTDETIQELVDEAIADGESLEYAQGYLLSLMDKYRLDDEDTPDDLNKSIEKELYKYITRLYYESDGDKSSYYRENSK